MNLKKSLELLCSAPGPAGFESPIAQEIEKLLPSSFDEVQYDGLGSLIAYRRDKAPPNQGKRPLLMIDAHMDEIGLIITNYSDDGFLKFAAIGGMDARVLPNSEVLILSDPLTRGVITCLPPHLQSQLEMDEYTPLDSMYIDVGGKKSILPGTPVVFSSDFIPLKNKRYASKSLDNRACISAALQALYMVENSDIAFDIAFCASTLEEIGCRGARTSAFDIDPDWAIVLDVTYGNSPDTKKSSSFDFGGLTFCAGPEISRELTQKLVAVAEELNIKYSYEVYGRGTGTNASSIQVSRGGVPCAVISIPLRYMHTPSEVVSINDISNAAKLLASFITGKGGVIGYD